MEIDGKYYEPRFVENLSDKDSVIFATESKEEKSLFDVYHNETKIVLLGNPGAGKSFELKALFYKVWETKNETGVFPIFIDLKNFRLGDKLEDHIKYENWNRLPRVVFILDGLDEVANIQDFISALELFIAKNSDLNPKYIISCRTNIYDKYLIKIDKFELYRIKELNRDQIQSILKNSYQLDVNVSDEEINKTPIFYSPFFLELLANYYSEYNELPKSNLTLWELFIDKGLMNDKTRQKRGLPIIARTKQALKKIALISELQHKNYITYEQLLEIIPSSYLDELTDNRLFEYTDESKETLKFSHRQIQEYFVASIFARSAAKSVIEFIKVPGVDAINPTFFNVVSFLLGIYDSADDYNELLNWLINNSIETLIKADSDRIDISIRKSVFQTYFTEHCIKQTLWVNTASSVSDEELANFGDCVENSRYLLETIFDEEINQRARISAIGLISEMTKIEIEQIRTVYFDLLKNEQTSRIVKRSILDSINSLGLSSNAETLDEIVRLFREETEEEMNSSLLYLIESTNTGERYFDYLKVELKRILKVDTRENYDDVQRGNNWTLQKILLQFDDEQKFLELFLMYLNYRSSSLQDYYLDQLLERISYYNDRNDNFVSSLILGSFDTKIEFGYQKGEVLEAIIEKCDYQFKAFKVFLDNDRFEPYYWFLAQITTEESVDYLLSEHNLLDKSKVDVYRVFRNHLIHNNKMTEAVKLQDQLVSLGYNFSDDIITIDFRKNRQSEFEKKKQEDFDVLFHPEKLIFEITKIYQDEELNSLTRRQLSTIERKLAEERRDWSTEPNSSLSLLRTILFYETELPITDIDECVIDERYRFLQIVGHITNENKRNKIKLKEEHLIELRNLSNKLFKKIRLDDMFSIISHRGFTFNSKQGKLSFELFKGVHRLFEESLIQLEKDFMLKSLKYYKMDTSEEASAGFESLILKINDPEKVKEQIIDNLRTPMFSFSAERHWTYILNNQIEEGYSFIHERLLNDTEIYSSKKFLETYIAQSHRFDLLLHHTTNMNSASSWTCLSLLEEKYATEYGDYIDKKAIEYLSSEQEEYNSTALRILFRRNHLEAINFTINHLQNGIIDNIGRKNYSNYNQICKNDLEGIQAMFNFTYSMNSEEFIYSSYQSFLNIYVSNLSQRTEYFSRIQEILNVIRSGIHRDKDDLKYFHINMLISVSQKNYITALSKPLSFNEALTKVKELTTSLSL
jgi:hypothetical protein